MKVKFKKWDCVVRVSKYRQNDRTALILEDEHDGEPIATATLNINEVPLEEDEVIIKDYSENAGIYEALHNAKIIDRYSRIINTGFVEAYVCKFLHYKKD
jgi:hypothetical protein